MLDPNDQFPDLWITACNSAPITWSRRRIIRLEAPITTTFNKISKNISGLQNPAFLSTPEGQEARSVPAFCGLSIKTNRYLNIPLCTLLVQHFQVHETGCYQGQ